MSIETNIPPVDSSAPPPSSFSAGSVIFASGTAFAENNSAFYWNDANTTLNRTNSITNDSGATYFEKYLTSDPNALPFWFSAGSSTCPLGSRNDVCFTWGYNMNLRGKVSSADCSWGIQLETFWYADVSTQNVEYHLDYNNAAGTATRRPFQFRVSRVADYTSGLFGCDIIDIYDAAYNAAYIRISDNAFKIGPSTTLQFHHDTGWATIDTALVGSSALLEQRNGTAGQSYYLYNTYTSSTNYERLELKWDSNVCKIQSTAGSGGGTGRQLNVVSGSNTLYLGNNFATLGFVNAAFSCTGDNVVSLGTSALRWTTLNTSGAHNIYSAASDANPIAQMSSTGFSLGAGGASAVDVILTRASAGVLTQQNGSSAQEFRIYGTTTGPKYLSLLHNGTNAIIDTNSGTMTLSASGSSTITFSNNFSNFSFVNATLQPPDGVDSLGDSTHRWVNLYITSIIHGTRGTPTLGFFNSAAVGQQTATGASGYSDSGATTVHSAGTFTGGVGATAYTIGDIVAALKNYGLLLS